METKFPKSILIMEQINWIQKKNFLYQISIIGQKTKTEQNFELIILQHWQPKMPMQEDWRLKKTFDWSSSSNTSKNILQKIIIYKFPTPTKKNMKLFVKNKFVIFQDYRSRIHTHTPITHSETNRQLIWHFKFEFKLKINKKKPNSN